MLTRRRVFPRPRPAKIAAPVQVQAATPDYVWVGPSRPVKVQIWVPLTKEQAAQLKGGPLFQRAGGELGTVRTEESTIKAGDRGFLEWGPSVGVYTRSGRGYASDAYFVREGDQARAQIAWASSEVNEGWANVTHVSQLNDEAKKEAATGGP